MNLPHKVGPFLWRYIAHFKWSISTIFFCIFVWALNEAIFPYFVKLMVDRTQSLSVGELTIWQAFSLPIMGIIATWVAMEIAMRVAGIVEVYFYPKYRSLMRTEVFEFIKHHSHEYFTSQLAGSIGSKVADIPKSSQYILEHLYWHVGAISMVFVLSMIIVAQVSYFFMGLLILWCTVHMGVTIFYLKESNKKMSDYYESTAKLNGETVDIITNALTMSLFARAPFETKRIKNFQEVEIRKSMTAAWCMQKVNFIRGIAGLTFIFATIYLLLKGWNEGWISPGDFPLIAMTSFNLMGMIWQLSMALLDLSRDMGTLKGALSLLESPHSVVDKRDAKMLRVLKGTIELKDVTFSYRQHNQLFHNLSLRINAGEKVGLVGFSGSGKTTLVNLILRSYDVDQGEILIDDQLITDVTQASLRQQIALIPQDPSLFHRSVLENIRYGRIDATDEEVMTAAQKAHCDEFIRKLEHGYNTVVGERGLKLSGGQRQRIAIARAILKDAPILILDEATSALDSVTEKMIQDSLNELMKGRTTIVVAHRLSTLKTMDRIIVFDRGKVVEDGTQHSLMRKNGYFSRMWGLQQEGFLPDKEG
jgi:ATP-binding cassette subfamily B protein